MYAGKEVGDLFAEMNYEAFKTFHNTFLGYFIFLGATCLPPVKAPLPSGHLPSSELLWVASQDFLYI